ncbi:MAG: GTP-binding protein [Oscillospiraceae bacterium]|nr:GTP-binding protein [Oscillospiraceae bacterium]
MTRIDIFSGFLGAGKTTLIRKLIAEGYQGEKLVLIENEFGEIAIDGGFLKDAGVQITEMNSGCICCTLVGDFTKALKKVMEEFAPDRILIEPSGVGKLSDVAAAVERVEGAQIGAKVTVVDAGKCRMYMRNFGEFFNDQVANADLIVMSRTDTADDAKVLAAAELLKGLNDHAGLITTPWAELNGAQIKEAMEANGLRAEMEKLQHEHEHHHHDHDEDEEHEHHHHHHDGEECDDPECECHHHHDHDEDGEHHHHHHHHADEIFTSWGMETPRKFSEEELRRILGALENQETYGVVLRAKGIVDASDGQWLYFDYVPGEVDLRRGGAAVTGRFCVIGSKLNEQALKELFNIE